MPFISSLSPSSNLSRAAFRFSAVAFILSVMAVAPKAAAQCTAAAGMVQICSPGPNASVASPVQFVATSNLSPAATSTKIYIDYQPAYSTAGPSVNTALTLAAGSHHVTIQSYNGAWKKSSETITVTTAAPPPPPPGCTAAAGAVQICLPAANATVAAPVHVVGASNLSPAATSTLVYVDNMLQYTSNGPAVDTNVTIPAATHDLLLQSYNGSATDGGWVQTSAN